MTAQIIDGKKISQEVRDEVAKSVEERKAHVQAKAKERTEIQQKIQQLNTQRQAYIAAEMKKLQGKTDTLGSAIIKAVHDQAQKRNFTFERPQEPSKTPQKTGNPQ